MAGDEATQHPLHLGLTRRSGCKSDERLFQIIESDLTDLFVLVAHLGVEGIVQHASRVDGDDDNAYQRYEQVGKDQARLDGARQQGSHALLPVFSGS